MNKKNSEQYLFKIFIFSNKISLFYYFLYIFTFLSLLNKSIIIIFLINRKDNDPKLLNGSVSLKKGFSILNKCCSFFSLYSSKNTEKKITSKKIYIY